MGSVLHVVLNARYWTCSLSGRERVCTRCMKRVWLSPLCATVFCPECGICTAVSMECTLRYGVVCTAVGHKQNRQCVKRLSLSLSLLGT